MNTATLTISRIDAYPLDEPIVPGNGRRARRVERDVQAQPTHSNAAAGSVAGKKASDAAVAASAASSQQPARGGLLALASLIVLVWAAWHVSRLGLFKPKDDISYWIAVTGGSMMVLLFTFPLRKHVRFMRGLGRVKWWFWTHLFLGIAGPWLILVHSGFHSASLNAGVALYSMVIVVCSGVVGLCIYTHVHRGLHGERTSLQELSRRAGFVETDARSRLHFAPRGGGPTAGVRGACGVRGLGGAPAAGDPVTFATAAHLCSLRRSNCDAHCANLPRSTTGAKASCSATSGALASLVRRYLNAVVRVAQYTAFERLFAQWHVAHLPFVYLMVISAVVHVIAVHAY